MVTEHQLWTLHRIASSHMPVQSFYRNQRAMRGLKIWGIDDKENTNFDTPAVSALLDAKLIHRVTPGSAVSFDNILEGRLEATDEGRTIVETALLTERPA